MRTRWIYHIRYKLLGLALGAAVASFIGIEDFKFQSAKAQFKSVWTKTGTALNGSDVYIKEGSKKTIRSVQFSNTIYQRADFSFTDSIGNTTTRRLVVDCTEWSYKDYDNQPGYYIDLSWVTPFTSIASIESIGLKYLCPGSKYPWVEFSESSGSLVKIYYINAMTISEDKNPKYGAVRSAIVVEGYKNSRIQSSIFMFYVACRQGRSGTLDMEEYMRPSNPLLNLTEANPGSLGEGWSEILCGVKL